ncbi:RIO1 family regulatory kinase/ATPase domain-containing protein [Pyxidicoccus xibeiensis]|uniref:RIO1 family regulatory kinase/ATPase domain-containing protein n=1 Tax=Pyxidicoccus xibeiensis TaxID=2906759 RepID=UPI0020A777D7|nr:RIO1 family regulatory kinase/ATPase [Pyxidicoccus xibeiensis]MCP3143535.1 hypothetical protein [Pyxidicoccus xibeiensis]
MNDSLETLLADGIIEAVIGQLKTGKEAEVWLVQHAGQVVAAKLYKERHERNFRNNVGYREGREVRNSRTRRAMEKGSRFGQAAAEEAWKSAESDSLYKLHAQGVRVPAPVLFYEGILLMEVVLDAQGHPAPRLVEAPPATPEEAQALYVDLRSQVVNMLCADLIHGDLSPFNILMSWQGAIIIDFPQTVAAARNNQAEFYFRRDLDNVRNFLAGIAPQLYDAEGDTSEIWNAYVRRELSPGFTPRGGFRDTSRRGGFKGPRDARPGFPAERGGGFRPEPEPALVAVPQANMTPEEAAEAELRELEALVLKQGGGERGKPAAAPPPRGGRNRGPGRGPPRNGGNRPASAGGGGPRPPATEQRGGAGARPPPNGPRQGNTGARPPPPNGQRAASNGQRPENGARAITNERPASNGQRDGRPARNEQRGGVPTSAPVTEQRAEGGGRPPRGEQRPGGNGRPPRSDARGGEPREANGAPGRTEQRPGGNGRPPRGDARGGGSPYVPAGEPREANGAPPRAEHRGNGAPSREPREVNGAPPRVEQRGNGAPPREPREATGAPGRPERRGNGAPSREPREANGAPGRTEQRGGNGAPPREPRGGNGAPRGDRRGGPRSQPVVESRPSSNGQPTGPETNTLRESRSPGPGNTGSGPRQPRQGQGRGGPRPPRSSSPQVSFVGRPTSSSDPGPHETGS